MKKMLCALLLIVSLISTSAFAAPAEIWPGDNGNVSDLITITKPPTEQAATAEQTYLVSGNGKAEENMARHIASREMSLFAMDYDHNAPNPEHLQATHERLYRIVREAQPQLPIVMITRPDFDKNHADGTERRNIILATYNKAIAEGDQNVYFVDGERFFGNTDRDLCTVDGCHPTDIGFLRMADTMEFLFRRILYK